jgi:hypothetical protein
MARILGSYAIFEGSSLYTAVVTLPFLKRCHICGAKEGLSRCVVCNRWVCNLHMAGGKCYSCLEKETIGGRTEFETRPRERTKEKGSSADGIRTKIKFAANPPAVLADMYLFLGGRPGSQRCTILMGTLHLDQRNHQLLFDRQVARRINAATFIRARSPGLGEVETHPYYRNPTRRLAHDQILRTIDLVCRSISEEGMQVIGGDGLLEEIELNEDMSCPKCGAWRETCLCKDKPQGTMSAVEYFKLSTSNRLKQRQTALKMEGDKASPELIERVSVWRATLESYL